MKTRVGLWIDHREAIILLITNEGEEVKSIISKVEKQPRRSGDSPLKGDYESLQVPASDSQQKNFTEHLKVYYDSVVAVIRDAKSILIFGPGEAKGELSESLKKHNLDKLIIGVETADKMTETEIVEKVRNYFHNELKNIL